MQLLTYGPTGYLYVTLRQIPFNPQKFLEVFAASEYQRMIGIMNISANPNTPSVNTSYYVKGDFIVIYNPRERLLKFNILNSFDFEEIYKTSIIPILSKLNIIDSNIQHIGFNVRAEIHDVDELPENILTGAANKENMKTIGNRFGYDDMKCLSIQFANAINHTSKDDLILRVEPLATNPQSAFFVYVLYNTNSVDNFAQVISKVNKENLLNIITDMNTA